MLGEGEAVVDTVEFTDLFGAATTEFFLENGAGVFPITIPENEQKTIQVCFPSRAIAIARRSNGCALQRL